MTHQLPKSALPSKQRGMSATGVVAIIITAVLCLKLGVSIGPAQISDYQLSKAIADELSKSNRNKESKAQFVAAVKSQLTINGYYDVDVDERYQIKGKPGRLSVYKNYQVESNFLPNVFITNKFEGEIKPAGTE